MGLFSSKSKSSSTTNLYDYSTNISADFSNGDLGGGSDKNIVAGGSVYVDGMSEDVAGLLISGIQGATDKFVDGSIQQTDKFVDGAIDLTKDVLKQGNELFNDTFGWIQDTIGGVAQQTDKITSALQSAYNSEQATHSAFKTYALYGLIGFIAWSYFSKKR